MGGRGRRKGYGKGRNNKNADHVNGERQSYKKFEELRRDNDSFRKYYVAQRIVEDDEFPAFMEAMRTVLPTNFRITGSRQQAIDIREQIMHEFIPYIKETSIDGADIEPPHPLEWYPNNFGWQFSIPRIALKKSNELSKFHSFLVTETEVGNISRQEAVSMVPPLLLDVHSNHYVLDMCAAPGSKTAQLLEALHADVEEGKTPAGFVIANDADYKRACMLVHQMNRLNSPNIIVTNHSGERFPNIYQADPHSGGSKREIVQFDRILCDVPCSGDGTTRKNVRIWEKWRSDDAHSLNPLQSKILQRAAYLLKTGGRLVYSTCSLNPIENEAIIAHVLDHFEGALRLVDVSEQLVALKRRPGLKTWKVMTRDGNLHDSFETISLEEGGRSRRKYIPNFFPLTAERMDELHIERCMRIYPHLQNTGGFFVAVLEKVAPISVDEKKKAAADAARFASAMDKIRDQHSDNGTATKRQAVDTDDTEEPAGACEMKRAKFSVAAEPDRGGDDDEEGGDDGDTAQSSKKMPYLPDSPREDPALSENPFVFLDADKGELKTILDYYSIKNTMSKNGFLSRIENGDFRSVYYVSDSVRDMIQLAGQRLRVVNTGIKVFSRNCVKGAGCAFRLVCEGVPLLLPHLPNKYVVDASFSDIKSLLEDINPLLTALSPETQECIKAVDPSSSIIIRYDPAKHLDDKEKPYTRLTAVLVIPCWRGHASLSVHMDKNQLCSLIQRVLGRTINKNAVGGFKLTNNRKSQSEAPAASSPATKNGEEEKEEMDGEQVTEAAS
ncbi:tRNA (cytosine-5-)-methyltransferase ncl1 [Coemansia spiralis]|uniref:tRNA (Cytosine-5-)-methyltransferase ncl1 n=2 Tax=Coemansia TaxID=4863 RepID=A0A9W8G9D9_9FUNG|nr:S-adenosyl-L-methionine-dependent methyltransferase [Coemansia spiralis]KAJ1990559.1 tRNA (cytosine-5-)-methyltransferase ncl1 [Coemansia umbellata]KAJ2624893.1 tRNA (cytosine-5-)-methyltransferase ncl1 [Coemansia sp. RSA 1358]KAJ2679200.1 tRNA (cytosine-5-)-methyltransferase ncl1 [Coemansia spiralis]